MSHLLPSQRPTSDIALHSLQAIAPTVEEIVLKSPADGFVTDVFVQPGLLVNAGDRSMKAFVVMGKSVARMILDKAPYWVEGSLFADQYALLKEGMKATVRLPDGRSIQRTVTQVLPGVDPKTQRGRFYIDLKQSVPGLVMGQPVKISVDMRLEEGMWVPRSAVLSQGFDPLVYVRLSKNRFSRRPVSINGEAGEFIRVTGVRQGEIVVTEGKMILEGLYRMSGQRDRHNGHDHNH